LIIEIICNFGPKDLWDAAPKLPPEMSRKLKEMALDMFFDASSPLPRASSMHRHYEAITRADNLMMELLRLYLVSNEMEIQSGLVYTER
jgi:hypothetical protein